MSLFRAYSIRRAYSLPIAFVAAAASFISAGNALDPPILCIGAVVISPPARINPIVIPPVHPVPENSTGQFS